jgi:NAD-dependent SIR2 family protein deacetylase
MIKHALLLASVATVLLAIGIRMPTAQGADPCHRTEFQTEMVKAACTTGGQAAAKDAMKAFNKDKKIKSCNQCHAKLAPNFELKDDALKQFKDLGGQ